jgi:methylglutaconyl-CoA hydratase/polyketide biosynthesis enoyl-CoA hydratase PksH
MELMETARKQVPPVINGEGVRAFARELERACSNQAHQVILLAGSEGTFCRGMDLATLANLQAETGDRPDLLPELEEFARCLRQIRYSGKPVIAVVDGEVLAGGVGIVSACDLVVATTNSSFGLSELPFGMIPAIVMPLLLERMPSHQVRLWALTAGAHSASEAQRTGLVDVVVEPTRLERTVSSWIRQLSRADHAAIAKLKTLLAEVPAIGIEAALRRGVSLTSETLREESVLSRIRSFLDGEAVPWEVA